MPENEEQDPPLEVYWDDLRIARQRAPEPEEVGVRRFGDLAEPGDMAIGTSRGRILVIIKPDGELQFGPEYRPQEAAMVFWEHMARYRLIIEERALINRHMEAILVQLGRQDLICENLRQRANDEQDPSGKAELTQAAEMGMHRLNMIAHQAIELGRGLVRRPEMEMPAVPERIPETIRQNPDTEYQGREGLPPENLGER